MLALPPPQTDHFSLIYIRQPGEEAEVIVEAHRRMGLPLLPPRGITARYLMIGAIGGAALSLFLHIYRSLILLPAFGFTPVIDVPNLLLICFLPCLAVYVLTTLHRRHESHLQRIAMAGRIRPDATVKVTISPEAIVWEQPGVTSKLAWAAIAEIADRHGRIEFDSDGSVHYIPAHAFHNSQEQAAVLERILHVWQPLEPQKS